MPADATSRTEVRLHGDLGWFCRGADDRGTVVVPSAGRRSVKDLVESVGVPHVEVGFVLVDGEQRPLDDVVDGPDRVSVHPPDHTPAPDAVALAPAHDRFVADVHLGTLARLLRLLGFDTWWRRDADDVQLAVRSVDDDRVLLSRDRQLLMRRAVTDGYCPRSTDPDTQLREVVGRYRLQRRVRPFTRCAACNGELETVRRGDVLARLPPRTRVEHDSFARCPGCDRVYWPGSHVDALRERFPDLLV